MYFGSICVVLKFISTFYKTCIDKENARKKCQLNEVQIENNILNMRKSLFHVLFYFIVLIF